MNRPATIGDVVAKLARSGGRRVALIDDVNGVERTFAELDRRRRQLANALAARGLRPGDRVAVILPNGAAVAEVIYGITAAGMIQVNVNDRLAASEIAHILNDSGAAMAIVDSALVDRLDEAHPDLPRIVVDGAAGPYADVLATSSDAEPSIAVDPDSPALLIYTSGTTGRPKGVTLTHRNVIEGATNYLVDCFAPGGGTFLACFPYFHVACVTNLAALLRGMTVVITVFDAARVAFLIERHRVTHLPMAPTAVAMLLDSLDAEPRDMGSLRWVLYAGAPMPEALLRRGIDALGPIFEHAYGMTETSATVTVLHPAEHDLSSPGRLASCGRELTRVDVDVVDANGEPVANGSPGEIVVRGANVMEGYWGQPEATEAAFFGEWFRTGDLGVRDDDGFLTIVGRLKDMIISGGNNVYPVEVEKVLEEHPHIKEVAVLGVPHEVWGETVAAVVVGDSSLDVVVLRGWCAEHLAAYKIPRIVFHVDALPRNAIGKVDKPALRASVIDQ